MKYTITATEHDGLDTRTLVINLDVFKENIDVVEACKEATREFVATTDGLKTYIGNCDCFNWADFEAYVPNDICEKYGFRKIDSDVANIDVNWDEQLIDEPTFLVTDIQWDTDGEEIDDLPTEYYIPFSDLMYEDEDLGDVDIDELEDRVADYLSDQFGWCINGLVIN